MFWNKVKRAIKLGDNLFWNKEAKSHLPTVAKQHLLLILFRAKYMENSLLVIFCDAHAFIIDHEDYLLACLIIWNENLNDALVWVLYRILDQVDSYLLQSHWVANHVQRQNAT